MSPRLLLLWLQCKLALSLVPVRIPKVEPGLSHSPHSLGARAKVEVFLDLNCPDSLTAWRELKQLGAHYGPDQLDLVVHQYPLPFHDHAHLASQGFTLIRDFVGREAAFSYMESVLSQWYQFGSSNTEHLTKATVKDRLADLATSSSTITRDQFLSYVDQYRSSTAQEWKYGARRGVAGTPWYFINGVDLTMSSPLTFNDLKVILDSLLDIPAANQKTNML